MPRANRHFLPGLVWHLTHRCHERTFLLKFGRDRSTYLRWLFEAHKRFGLCVLNYMVTSNHVHLLVKDNGGGVIARSIQLAAGRTAQEYNRRKGRLGAFWQDRYHATAIEADVHLHRCLVYIDLNMVRAGVVKHPSEWLHSGYQQIQRPPERYCLVDLAALSALCGFEQVTEFRRAHHEWVEAELADQATATENRWSESIAVGRESFVNRVKEELGFKAKQRQVTEASGAHTLREAGLAYGEHFKRGNEALTPDNTVFWEANPEITDN